VRSSEPSLQITVKQILDDFDKVPPQEQVFVMKSGGVYQIIDQDIIQNILYIESKAKGYEKYFDSNPDYLQTKRTIILRTAYEQLVVNTIQVSDQEIADRSKRIVRLKDGLVVSDEKL